MNEVYLDNSSTTRVCETAAAKVMELMTENYGNPSSLHALGFRAEQALTQARRSVAAALGAKEEEVFFTSGGTESNNLAIFGAAYARKRMGMHIVTTQIEHPSVANAVRQLEKEGWEVTWLQPDREGHIAPEAVLEAVRPDTTLVSMMAVNNEVGTILPIEAAARAIALKKAPALLHVDAVQAFGKLDTKPERKKIDLMSISAHKIHGPKGVGALYVKSGVRLVPRQMGGGQENAVRSGTENTPGIAGLMRAIEEMEAHTGRVQDLYALKGKFWALVQREAPEAVLNGPEIDQGAPHILNISFPGVRGEVMLHALEGVGVYCSTGSACSSKKRKLSPVLLNMGLDAGLAEGALRFSLSIHTTDEEIEYAAGQIGMLYAQLKRFRRR